jgi:hypothetical protein
MGSTVIVGKKLLGLIDCQIYDVINISQLINHNIPYQSVEH